MRKISLFTLLFFSLSFSAQALSETQKLESLCKVWGFLKYYHPHVSKGDFDWDKQLFEKMDELNTIRDKDQLNEFYSKWINSLGKVDECKKCSKEDKEKVYSLRNFDLNWILNKETFNEEITQKLLFIQNNRNSGSSHYFGKG
jgi:hypothetical protein